MDELRLRFGKLVAANRRAKGMTQQQLAEEAGISVAMVNRIERGISGARFKSIEKIADALKVDPAALFSTEVSSDARSSSALASLNLRIAGLSEADVVWVSNLIEAGLKARR